jgi:D-galactarolactone cycloisomerase
MSDRRSRIAAIEAFVLVGDKDYVGGAGLTSVSATKNDQRALADVGDLHICAYPPQAQTCIVKITTEDGTFGWGEGHAPLGPRATRAVVEDVLAPLLVGQDALAIDRHWERMYGSMRLRGHVAGYQLEAMSAVDIALWDVAGKLLDAPVYTLLGGPFRTELPAYASGVPGATVDERVSAALRFVADGYTAVKASIGRGDIDTDLAGLAALAEALRGKANLLVDAHGAYTAENVLNVGRSLQELGVYWLEDPLPPEDVAGYAHLAGALEMAIAAGETECTRWQFEERLSRRAVDVILPDICRAGGISEGRRIATVASLHNTRWAAHVSMGSSIHVAAAAHLAAASASFLIFEFSSTPNPIGDDLLTAPLHPETGHLRVPDLPGLGIAFDENKLNAHILDDRSPRPVSARPRKIEHDRQPR